MMQTISSRILKRAFPMAGARLINMLSVFIGMIMIAQLGHDVLAASAIISAGYFTVIVIFMFLLFSVGVVVGNYYGEEKFFEIGDIVQQGFLLALLIAIPMSAIFYFSGNFLYFFGQNPLVVPYVAQFFKALIWMVVPMLLLTCVSQFMFAVTEVLQVIVAYLVGIVVFVIAAYALIFGHYGFTALGVAGFAYAIVLQETSMLLYLLFAYALKKKLHCYALFDFKRSHDWSIFARLWQVGWPMSIQFGTELVGFLTITLFVGWLGINDLAAWQVVQQAMMIFIVPIFSFSEASAIVVGHVFGAKDYDQVNKVNRVSTLFGMSLVLCGIAIFVCLPTQIAHIYMDHQTGGYQIELQHMITLLFCLNAFVYFFDSLRNLMSGSLRGLYDTRFAMITGIIVVWVIAVLGGYVFAFRLGYGVYGFPAAQAIAFCVGAIAVWCRWRWQMQRINTTPTLPLHQNQNRDCQ